MIERYEIRGVRLPRPSPDIAFVWLDCPVSESIERKRGIAPGRLVEQQHRRYATRYRLQSEHVIDTKSDSIEGVVAKVLSALALSAGT